MNRIDRDRYGSQAYDIVSNKQRSLKDRRYRRRSRYHTTQEQKKRDKIAAIRQGK